MQLKIVAKGRAGKMIPSVLGNIGAEDASLRAGAERKTHGKENEN